MIPINKTPPPQVSNPISMIGIILNNKISKKSLAKQLNCNEATIDYWIKHGKITKQKNIELLENIFHKYNYNYNKISKISIYDIEKIEQYISLLKESSLPETNTIKILINNFLDQLKLNSNENYKQSTLLYELSKRINLLYTSLIKKSFDSEQTILLTLVNNKLEELSILIKNTSIKTCKKCKKNKDLTMFYKTTSSTCKECTLKKTNSYIQKNKEYYHNKAKTWQKNNAFIIKLHRMFRNIRQQLEKQNINISERIKNKNETIQSFLSEKLQYFKNITINYDCNKCKDTGIINITQENIQFCDCTIGKPYNKSNIKDIKPQNISNSSKIYLAP